MRKIIILTCVICFICCPLHAQKVKTNDPIKSIHKLFEETLFPSKDSLIIYAVNFEVSITKKNGKALVTTIEANDSLAFTILPSYKKLFDIDFNQLIGNRTNMRLIIPILMYGSSPEKMFYKDKDSNPLISLNAAVNAAYALYNPSKYNNNRDAKVSLEHRVFKDAKKERRLKGGFWEAMIMEPIIFKIENMK